MIVAGIVALIGGLLQGAEQVVAAFPSFASLGEGAAWARLFAGLTQLAVVGLFVLVVALIWRWRIKRAIARRRAAA
jgi:hypothetical protein